MKIGIIGAGHFGKAIMKGLRDSDNDILVSDKNAGEYEGIEIINDNKKVAKECDILFIAVKPDILDDLLDEIKDHIVRKLVISFAVGVMLDFYKKRADAKFVRAMGNISISEGQGFVGYYGVSSEFRGQLEVLLKNFGSFVEVDKEFDLDLITGLSGSGIAYFIKIMSEFIRSGCDMGLGKEASKRAVLDTMKGSIALMEESNDFNGLISSIAVKGGTTEKGLEMLEKGNICCVIESVVCKTVEACERIGSDLK